MFDVRSVFAAFRRGPGPKTPFERGVVALAEGDHAAAVREFECALAEGGDAPQLAATHNKRGVALVALGRRGDALEAFCAALGCHEQCAAALVNLGNMLLEDGHPHDAIDYYEAAIRADEAYPAAYRNLGIALRRLGRRSESVKALRSADRIAGRLRRPRA
jgi:tetratricopeptide (TPR) repeat protein